MSTKLRCTSTWVMGRSPLHYWNYNATTSIADEIPPAPNTNPILFAIGSIVCSLIAILGYLRWKDASEGRHRSKLAHAYIAPALIALAVLTFYPVIYGIWLSFTDANQTHLGDQSWIGLENFGTVLTSSGFLRDFVYLGLDNHQRSGTYWDWIGSSIGSQQPTCQGSNCIPNCSAPSLGHPVLHFGTGLERHVTA